MPGAGLQALTANDQQWPLGVVGDVAPEFPDRVGQEQHVVLHAAGNESNVVLFT